jgi:hypothetical protein
MITTLAVTALCLVAIALAYFVGRTDGIVRGRNEQWVDDYFDNLKNLRSLRDELGRFKHKKTTKKPNNDSLTP